MSSIVTDVRRAARDARPTDLPAVVDWIAGGVIVLIGLGLLAAGSAVTFLFDRSRIETEVASRSIEVRHLSEAEMTTVAVSAMEWAGYGLLIVGTVVFAGGVAFVSLRRRRARQDVDHGTSADLLASGVLGAVTGAVLWFLPFSPAVGGAAAAVLAGGDARRHVAAGALAGLLLVGPFLTVMAFAGVGIVLGALAAQIGPVAAVPGLAIAIGVLTMAAAGAALGALGGSVGGWLAVE